MKKNLYLSFMAIAAIVMTTSFSSCCSNDDFESPVTPTGPDYVVIGGLKWATMNLGATTVAESAATSFGDYYAWGATETWYSNVTWAGSTPTFTWKSSYTDGYSSSHVPTVSGSALSATEDIVTIKLGGNWRMPTSAEFKSLADACNTGSSSYTVTTTTTLPTSKGIYWYAGSGITNYGVTGMFFHDGTNYVFFPAADAVYYTSRSGAGTYGFYWSSSLYTSTSNAYCLGFFSGRVVPQNDEPRYGGCTVRPVSN